MVKGISRQVIVVDSSGETLFDQAIFILKDNASEVSEERLLREAKQLIHASAGRKRLPLYFYGPAWAAVGALLTGAVWLLTFMLY